MDWPTTGGAMKPELLYWVVAGLCAPFVEEVLCRGLLYRGFAESRLGVPGAIVLTAALFTAFHLPEFADTSYWYVEILRITVIGLLFGWLRYRTGSVLPSWGFHTLHNGVAAPVMEHIFASSWGAPPRS